MNTAYHVVAGCLPRHKPLRDRNVCADLWGRLRRRFPKVGACVLMPDHLHILVFARDLRQVVWDLGVELRAWTQRFHPGRNIWAPILEPRKIPDFHHLRRQIRYVHLNPCRAGLASDPLQWEWSTHRDMVGCVSEAWPDLALIKEVFRVGEARLGQAVHEYVSRDPSVDVEGTPFVSSLKPGETISVSMNSILRASAVVLRQEGKSGPGRQRELTIQVAHHLRLGAAPEDLGISRRTWDRAESKKMDWVAVGAVLRVLSDPRCRPNKAQGELDP